VRTVVTEARFSALVRILRLRHSRAVNNFNIMMRNAAIEYTKQDIIKDCYQKSECHSYYIFLLPLLLPTPAAPHCHVFYSYVAGISMHGLSCIRLTEVGTRHASKIQ